jgi:ornithine carbamoyltransferase
VELDGRTHLLQDVEVAGERVTGRIDGRRFAARYEPTAKFSTYFYTVLGNLCRDRLRAERRRSARGETLEDTARVVSRFLDGIVIRTFAHAEIEAWAAAASIPVINGLSDFSHPCQILADLLTIREVSGSLGRVKVAYIGDGNNVAHSWILAAGLLGLDFILAAPEGYDPDPAVLAEARRLWPGRGLPPRVVREPAEAAAGADFLYTDVWTSMGQERETKRRLKAFRGFQIDRRLLARAKPGAGVLHCLPAHRGEEISAEVIDGPQSLVFEQAENRLHAQKALLVRLLGTH